MADQALSKGANVSLPHRSEIEEGRLQAVVRRSDPDLRAAEGRARQRRGAATGRRSRGPVLPALALRPLGTKRNGLRRAFIPSVNAAVDAFYAEIVQGLKPSVAPRLPAEVAEDAIAAVESL